MSTTAEPQTGELIIEIHSFAKGLDTKSSETKLAEGASPDLQNVNLPGGMPQQLSGSTIFTQGQVGITWDDFVGSWDAAVGSWDEQINTTTNPMVLPSGQEPQLLARHQAVGGTVTFLSAAVDGHVYSWQSTAFGSLRRGLSTTATKWWSQVHMGDYVIISNRLDGNFKFDGTRLLPLGALHISDMESTETWAGTSSSSAAQVRQGIASRLQTSTGAAINATRTPSTALDLVNGLLDARDYAATDRVQFDVFIDTAANVDTTNTYLRLGNSADTAYSQLAASAWGTLVDGWNAISVLRSAFVDTGGGNNWSSTAKITIQTDSTGASTVNIYWDDLYMIYAAADVMPAVQYNAMWKNIFWGFRTTADPSDLMFSPVNAPDEWTATAVFPVDDNDGDTGRGIKGFYDQLTLFKAQSIHALTGVVGEAAYPNYDFSLIRVTLEHVGTSSHRSIVEANRVLYFFDYGRIYAYHGAMGVKKISYLVEPTLQNFSPTESEFVVGATRHPLNQVWWWWTPAGGSQNTQWIRYDYELDAFIPGGQQAVAVAHSFLDGDEEYMLTGGYTGRILRQDRGTTFDGATITAYVTTPWISAGLQDEAKLWKEIRVQHGTATGTLIVEYRLADHPREFAAATFVTANSIDLAATEDYGRAFVGDRSRWIQVRLRTEGADLPIFPPIKVIGARLGQRI